MIYHHDDNHVTPVSPTASDLDPAKGVMLAVAIGFALALLLLNELAPCDGALLCALVAVPLRAKPHPGMPLAERAARNYPDSPALQQAYINAVHLVRSTKRGWLLDKPITRQERTQ